MRAIGLTVAADKAAEVHALLQVALQRQRVLAGVQALSLLPLEPHLVVCTHS